MHFFLNVVSAQLPWFNGHRFRVWCKPALMATPGSCTDDNPQTSPTYERRWRAQCFSDWSKPRQNFESLDENLTWLAIRGTRACVTRTEFQPQQSGMGLEPRQGPPVSNEASIVHCSILLLFPNIWTNWVCTGRRIQNSFKHKENNRRWIREDRQTRLEECQLPLPPICSWGWAE